MILKGIESKLYIEINDELKYFGEIEKKDIIHKWILK
ncbi:hypothetical protein LCGC14_1515900 [marine sediment metagenome]|uniref:Uncharacterized protein n=1 Tax=marine sediment metagenome TaxID=412755 RepID=A0A0F9M158_9ZZZZ